MMLHQMASPVAVFLPIFAGLYGVIVGAGSCGVGLNNRRLDGNHKTEYPEIQESVERGRATRYQDEGDQTITVSSVLPEEQYGYLNG